MAGQLANLRQKTREDTGCNSVTGTHAYGLYEVSIFIHGDVGRSTKDPGAIVVGRGGKPEGLVRLEVVPGQEGELYPAFFLGLLSTVLGCGVDCHCVWVFLGGGGETG